MNQDSQLRLLSLISYTFLPAKLGGHIAHVFFHNSLSTYCDDVVVSADRNQVDPLRQPISFRLKKVFRKSLTPYIPFSYFFELSRIIKEENRNAIFCSHPYLGLTAWALSKYHNISLIHYSHNIESERFRSLGKWWWFLLRGYEGWLMRQSKLIFFVAPEDRDWAIKNYNLDSKRCFFSPFGTELASKPMISRERTLQLRLKYAITESTKVFYFIGAFGYQPNDDAVRYILDEVWPRLSRLTSDFQILIIGKNLPQELQERVQQTKDQVRYLGFVDDVSEILGIANLMINPMLSGGGIKTKAVEALGNNIRVVSTENGAGGLLREACGDMLLVSRDQDWDAFVDNILVSMNLPNTIANEFYDQYNWSKVTKKCHDLMVQTITD
jgi:hypothetical protein